MPHRQEGEKGPREIRLLEVATGKARARFRGHQQSVYCLRYSPDGRFLLSSGSDTTVLV